MTLICFASPKGGVGKTMLAANLAGQLVRAGVRQVMALDLDPQDTMRLHFGISLGQRHGVMARLDRPSEWSEAVVNSRSGVMVMPYGAASFESVLEHNALLAARPELLWAPLRQLTADPATVVIVDTAPGPSPALAAILPEADTVVSVLNADAASLALLKDVKTGACYGVPQALASGRGRPRHRVIVNQFDPLSRLATSVMQGITSVLATELLGIVYRDEHVAEALIAQKLVGDYAPFSRAAADLSAATQQMIAGMRATP